MGGGSLTRRVLEADVEQWVAWAHALQRRNDNAYGVEVARFGSAMALLSHGAPVPFFNRVLGLRSADVAVVDQVVAYYRERQTPLRIDVRSDRSRILDRHLLERGMSVTGEQVTVARRLAGAEVDPGADRDIVVVDPDLSDTFASVYDCAYHGDGTPPLLARFRRETILARFAEPGWRFYLLRDQGEPIAGAILFTSGGVATLAGGATLPSHRGLGCQGALLRRRMHDAAEAGCDLVVSRCVKGSASHRNLIRAGLQDVLTKRIWEVREENWTAARVRRASVITAA